MLTRKSTPAARFWIMVVSYYLGFAATLGIDQICPLSTVNFFLVTALVIFIMYRVGNFAYGAFSPRIASNVDTNLLPRSY
jgi:hypothetical protein